MNCEEVRSELSAYLDGEVTPLLREAVEKHLAGCASCREELDALRQLVAGVAALPQLERPPQFLNAVRAKLAADQPVPPPNWVDALFRPIWLKVPLEALAVIVVAATMLTWPKAPPPRDYAASSGEQVAPRQLPARIAPAAPAETDKLVAPAATPAPVLAAADAEMPKDTRREAKVTATTSMNEAVDRVAVAKLEQQPKLAAELPRPPQVAPTSPVPAGMMAASAPPAVASNVVIAPIVIVHAGDFTKIRRQVETTAVQMGGQILSRTESQLNGKSGVVYSFQVQLPPGQVAAFRSQFASAKASEGARSLMGTPAVVQGELPAASTDTTARGAISYGNSAAAAKTKELPAVVEVQVVRPE